MEERNSRHRRIPGTGLFPQRPAVTQSGAAGGCATAQQVCFDFPVTSASHLVSGQWVPATARLRWSRHPARICKKRMCRKKQKVWQDKLRRAPAVRFALTGPITNGAIPDMTVGARRSRPRIQLGFVDATGERSPWQSRKHVCRTQSCGYLEAEVIDPRHRHQLPPAADVKACTAVGEWMQVLQLRRASLLGMTMLKTTMLGPAQIGTIPASRLWGTRRHNELCCLPQGSKGPGTDGSGH